MGKFITKFKADTDGATLPLFTIAVPLVITALAVSIEAGYWYKSKTDQQLITDLAAFAGALELSSSDSDTAKLVAELDAMHNGFDSSLGGIDVFSPYISGGISNPNAVEVIMTQKGEQYFSNYKWKNKITYRTRAVAEFKQGGEACVLALNSTESGAFTATGSTSVTLDKCAIGVNSNHAQAADFGGNSSTMAECLTVVGGIDGVEHTNFACGSPVTNASKLVDPYKNIAAPDLNDYPTCTNEVKVGSKDLTMAGGRYCSNITIKGTAMLDSDSTYIFDGIDVKFVGGASKMIGNGVTLILMNGAALTHINGGANVAISAPTSGPYKGIAIYSDPATQIAGESVKINGGSSTSIEGVMYYPTQDLEFSGNTAGTNACTVVVADKIKFTGNSDITTTGCESSFGLSTPSISGGTFLIQ